MLKTRYLPAIYSSGVRAIAVDGGLVNYNAKSKVHNKMLKIS